MKFYYDVDELWPYITLFDERTEKLISSVDLPEELAFAYEIARVSYIAALEEIKKYMEEGG